MFVNKNFSDKFDFFSHNLWRHLSSMIPTHPHPTHFQGATWEQSRPDKGPWHILLQKVHLFPADHATLSGLVKSHDWASRGKSPAHDNSCHQKFNDFQPLVWSIVTWPRASINFEKNENNWYRLFAIKSIESNIKV